MINDKRALAKSHSAQKLSTPRRPKKVASLQNLKIFKEDMPRDNKDIEKEMQSLERADPDQSVDNIQDQKTLQNNQQSRPKFRNRLQTPKNVYKIES